MTAFYNEINPVAAQWLRNLIEAGHIAPGVVDERSIEDIKPDELMGYTQCHFFAGVGVWSLALRRAGWPDHRPIWTGSCPCQPFSASGKKSGFDDDRHLWPAFHWLIRQCNPGVVTGEQVASKAAEPWLDLVQADLEAMGYAFGALAFPSASVGAPHIRDRSYWVGYSHNEGPQGYAGNGGSAGRQGSSRSIAETGVSVRVGNAAGSGSLPVAQPGVYSREESTRSRDVESERPSAASRLADSDRQRLGEARNRELSIGEAERTERDSVVERMANAEVSGERPLDGKPTTSFRQEEPTGGHGVSGNGRPGPTNGFWSDADWLFCRDGKWRPVEPGTFPLADGAPARVGRLCAYGNAINAEQATIFIESVMGVIESADYSREHAA